MSENTIPTAEIIEIVETDEEKAQRAEKERSERRWEITRAIAAHLERIVLCMDMLADSDVKDRATLAALAQRIRAEYVASLDLVPDHIETGGSYYEVTLQPFKNLYRR